jgi:hypothetical protein
MTRASSSLRPRSQPSPCAYRAPVPDELLQLRDAHDAALDAVDARLMTIEFDLSEATSWIERRLAELGVKLDRVLDHLDPHSASPISVRVAHARPLYR